MQRKQGIILNFNPVKQMGTIVVEEDGKVSRYFYYANRIISGPLEVKPGMLVSFSIDARYAVPEGLLPRATSIVVYEGAITAEKEINASKAVL